MGNVCRVFGIRHCRRRVNKSMIKVCTKCKLPKNAEKDFFIDRQKKNGRRPDCKICNQTVTAKWIKQTPERHRNHEIKSKYGVDSVAYEKQFKKQKGCCAICNRHQTELPKRLAIDHCHDTRKFRGLLCYQCNSAIGYFFDDVKILSAAIRYLKRSK